MVTMEFVAVFCVTGILWAHEQDLLLIDSIRLESACMFEGGMCVIANDCPNGSLVGSGLCPLQQRMGVECCYGISVKETRCQKRGGDCVTECISDQVYRKATGCPKDTICCSVNYQ
ncbi:uncharacterized protein LOC113506191 [Trichoplusia ni]|uniref:Uncharacterized protein LOC113506191 n=1 Tax=Trichoplusia ni TaxID=7111 RepID=A0A7E5WWD7_TRINI|nr:uncharacterized protein LOC113506191 [Trichoplusia ni]